MTNPGAYEQYPRPSVPAGPSSWQQPGFAETVDSPPPSASVAVPEGPRSASASAPARRELRRWAGVTLAAVVLSISLSLVAVTTQSTAFFGVAMLVAMGMGLGLLHVVRAALSLMKQHPGPTEDNG
ncbi:MAG: hypothetical protein ACOH16_13155 [Propionibacteriaceae bacterium]